MGARPVVRHRTAPRRAVLLGAAAALLAAGAAGAWALTGGEEEPESRTVVVTQTRQGETVERTVTESDTVTVEAPTGEGEGEEGGGDEGSGSGSGESGAELNDRGFALLQQGDVQGALPLLESAVSKLQGSATLAEAYASYNLAVARFSNGSCDGVADLLDRSEDVQGGRKEIDRLRNQVEKRCDEG